MSRATRCSTEWPSRQAVPHSNRCAKWRPKRISLEKINELVKYGMIVPISIQLTPYVEYVAITKNQFIKLCLKPSLNVISVYLHFCATSYVFFLL